MQEIGLEESLLPLSTLLDLSTSLGIFFHDAGPLLVNTGHSQKGKSASGLVPPQKIKVGRTLFVKETGIALRNASHWHHVGNGDLSFVHEGIMFWLQNAHLSLLSEGLALQVRNVGR